LIEATAASIAPLAAARVIDPVMVSRAGAVLLEPEAIEALKALLLPLADLLTPNVQEARLLAGRPLESAGDLELAAEQIAALGPRAVLIKGGGLQGLRGSDVLWQDGRIQWFRLEPCQHPTTFCALNTDAQDLLFREALTASPGEPGYHQWRFDLKSETA
jgi:hydroxymethylpyrimidine/phosphomethylpyrimidine kinase